MYTLYTFKSDSHRITDHGKRTNTCCPCVSSLVCASQLSQQTHSWIIQLSNWMEQQHSSWEVRFPQHEIPPILCDSKSHYCMNTARYLILSRAKPSTPSRYISLISTLILSSHLHLGLPSVFLTTALYEFPFSPRTYYMPYLSYLPLKSGNSTAQMPTAMNTTYEYHKRYSSTVILTGIRVFDLRMNAFSIIILHYY